MAEYIEREAFLDAIERGKKYQQDADDIAEMLQNFPAADVRPVVLCRDCKHWEAGWTPRGVSEGRHYCAPLDLFPSADWYCSDGERREES